MAGTSMALFMLDKRSTAHGQADVLIRKRVALSMALAAKLSATLLEECHVS
jgi:hypothetical protein